MNDMRDLSTMKHGETVYIYASGRPYMVGEYQGCANRRQIVVDTGASTHSVDVDSQAFHVEDNHGHVLGWVMEDPPLTTIPPELE